MNRNIGAKRWPCLAIGVIGIVVVACCATMGCRYSRSLEFNEQGIAIGTGWRTITYTNGAVQLREYYENGELLQSIWYRPNGEILETTDWVEGSGTSIYLHEDGSINAKIPYVRGVAHGTAVYYDTAGTAIEKKIFVDGKVVRRLPAN